MGHSFGIPGTTAGKKIETFKSPFPAFIWYVYDNNKYRRHDWVNDNVIFSKDPEPATGAGKLVNAVDNEGAMYGLVNFDPTIFKMDKDGDIIWTRSPADEGITDNPKVMAITHNGNLAVVSNSWFYRYNKSGQFIDKLDVSGNWASLNTGGGSNFGVFPVRNSNLFIITADQSDAYKIDLGDVQSGISQYYSSGPIARSFAVDENGRIYAAQDGGTIEIADTAGTVLETITTNENDWQTIAINQNYVVLAENPDAEIRVYDREFNEQSYSPLPVNGKAYTLAIDNRDRIYAANDSALNPIKIIDAGDGSTLAQVGDLAAFLRFPYYHYSAFNPS